MALQGVRVWHLSLYILWAPALCCRGDPESGGREHAPEVPAYGYGMPSIGAAGMDVFTTAKNVGWNLEKIPCKKGEYGKIMHSNIHSVWLVLTE